MPRGNKNNNDRGRGGGRWGARGRGPPPDARATPTPNRAPRHTYPHANAEIDVVIQQWSQPPIGAGTGANGGNPSRGYGPWRGRGTPKSGSRSGTPFRGTESPRRGTPTPRGRGRGRGRGGEGDAGASDVFSGPRYPRPGVGGKAKPMIGRDAPLSGLLYSDRPLLRPVKFVRATLTPFLFQHSEDVLKPAGELVADATETPCGPTADRVARVFQAGSASDSDSESGDQFEDALEEIDFADLAQVRAEVDAIAHKTAAAMSERNVHKDKEDIEEVDFADLGAIRAQVDAISQDATAATMDRNVHRDEEALEEVDFADLAAIRARVDAARPQEPSQDDIAQETFTGVYNQIKVMSQTSSTVNAMNASYPLPTPDRSFYAKSSIEISNQSNNESITHDKGANLVKVPDGMLGVPPETNPATVSTNDTLHHHAHSSPLFVIDTVHTRPLLNKSTSDAILVDRAGHGETLGDQDDEVIVYVAPHPRSRRTSELSASVVPPVTLPRTSMLTGLSASTAVSNSGSPIREEDEGPTADREGVRAEAVDGEELSLASLSLEPAASAPAATQVQGANARRRARRKEARWQRRQQNKPAKSFGAYGAMLSEARLREEDERERRRPKWETRRPGDSDLDWGTENEDGSKEVGDEVDALSDGLGGMELDPDLKIDVEAMQGFLKSMSVEGSRFVTTDDIEDEKRIQQEDEESGSGGSSDEEEDEEEQEVFDVEEQRLIAESDGDEFSDDSDDDGLSPKSGFQARLRKLREQSRARRQKTVQEISEDSEDDATEDMPWTRSADDEEFIARINDLLEENGQILSGRDRKKKKALFRHLHADQLEWDVEAFLDDPEHTTPVSKKRRERKKGKGKQTMDDVDLALQAQWEKDRAKKAARKRERATARLLAEAEADEGRGQGRRASRKAPRTVVDVASIEAQMRQFAGERSGRGAGAGGKPRASVTLPPMDRAARKVVHELAAAFGIKSVSKGKGAGRYTTLVRTAKTGVGVKEDKVRGLVRRYGWMSKVGEEKGRGGGGGGKGGRMPRQLEGEVVGKEAPKIGENNIGFKMLASMGWSEGDRIGSTASVGIEAPLTAVIKNSKLGLGATR